jgi:pyrroloquinoline quinone biosynthesis protein D
VSRLSGDAVLRFPAHVKFRYDERRQAWIVLAPERLFLPDEQAVVILRLIDGERTVGALIDALAAEYDAPRDEIATDITSMLQDLVAKRVLQE